MLIVCLNNAEPQMLTSLISAVPIVKCSKLAVILAIFGFILIGQLLFVNNNGVLRESSQTVQYDRKAWEVEATSIYQYSNNLLRWNVSTLELFLNFAPSLRWKQNWESVNEFTSIVPYAQYLLNICSKQKNVKLFTPNDYSQISRINSTNHDAPACKTHHLGLGHNPIQLRLINIRQVGGESSLSINLHLNFHRLNRARPPDSLLRQNCYYLQNCSWKAYADESCGLSSRPFEKGSWKLNCSSCGSPVNPGSEDDCDWDNAVWFDPGQPTKHVQLDGLQKCFDKEKTVLFIGDSTNRGIMFAIMKELNGSLQEWRKIHKHQTFENLGHSKNKFGFFYYPPFWLGKSSLGSFVAILNDFLNSQSNHAKSNLAIVIGGVQWLLPAHLLSLARFLNKHNLTESTTVIVKGYGVGFHVPGADIKGFPSAQSPGRFQKLVQRNRLLQEQSADFGYRFLDTFRMTAGRWRDYYPGKCACHYHYVVFRNGQYLIKGPVNDAYTSLVVSHICTNNVTVPIETD